MSDLASSLIFLPGLVVGLTVHEFAHAWSASLLGDDFARRQGRVSLNPLRHLSPLGTLCILFMPFGWGRPVMVNLYNFRHPKRDYLITSLAGPAANVVAVGVCWLLMHLTKHYYVLPLLPAATLRLVHMLLFLAVINAVLAAVNLLPLPPLDGSKIWPCLIPGLKPSMGKGLTTLSMIVLIFLVTTGRLAPMLGAVVETVVQAMPNSEKDVFLGLHLEGVEAAEAGACVRGETLLTAALAINPLSADSYHWRSLCRRMQSKLGPALQDITRAIDICSTEPFYYESRAEMLGTLGRAAEAREDWARAATLREGMGMQPKSQPATIPAGEDDNPL